MYVFSWRSLRSLVGHLPGGSFDADEKAQAKHAQFLRSDAAQAFRVI